MSRPIKYNLDYFPLDVVFFEDHKIITIEEKYGVKGGYIAIRIMAMVYSDHGYYLEWPDKFEYTCAKRVGNGFTGALVGEIFNECLRVGLFNKEIFDKFRVVTSLGIQKRWLMVMDRLRRKVVVSDAFWLIPSEEKKVSSEETSLPATTSTEKGIKGNEIKNEKEDTPDGVADSIESPPDLQVLYKDLKKDKVSIAGFIRKNKPQFIAPYYDLWNIFAEEKSIPKVTKLTKPRLQKFKVRIREKSFDFLQILKKAGQSEFLLTGQWFGFDWLIKNEVNYLKVIEGNYDYKGSQKPGEVKITRDVEYLFDRFKEGNLDVSFITPDHYEELEKAGLVQIDSTIIQKRMKSLFGSRIMSETDLYNDYASGTASKQVIEDRPMLMKLAVVEYFKKRKNQK